MPNYKNGKIYNIVSPDGKKYIGSTTQLLNRRFTAHKSKYKSWKEGKHHFVTSFNLFDEYGIDKCKIELIEEYSCNTKKELETREGYYIQTQECINKVIAAREDALWRLEHREELLEYWKQYYNKNIDKYGEKNKKYYANNKEASRIRSKLYREKNAERIKESRRLKRLGILPTNQKV